VKPLVRILILASALVSTVPVLAQELTVSAVKAFISEMDDAAERRDMDTVFRHISELCVISATMTFQGQVRTMRMNKTQYRQLMTRTPPDDSYKSERTNDKISIEGDQAIATADLIETMIVDGKQVTKRTRERATIENIDGTLILTQLVQNEIL
jgi:ketosteroid isomerase-like protein